MLSLLLLIYLSLLFIVSTFSSFCAGITFSCFTAQSCEECCEESCEECCEKCCEECRECEYILGTFFRALLVGASGLKVVRSVVRSLARNAARNVARSADSGSTSLSAFF